MCEKWDGKTERRRNRMPPNYEPQNAFEGYIVAKLEAMTDRLNALPCDETNKRLGKCENDISNIKGKATVWGAVMGFVAGIISKIIIWK